MHPPIARSQIPDRGGRALQAGSRSAASTPSLRPFRIAIVSRSHTPSIIAPRQGKRASPGYRKTPATRRRPQNRMTRAAHSRIFIDGNNVMGSRPDGWWRDRAGAVRRLVTEIIPLALGHGGVWTIVFDGKEPPRMPPPPNCLIVVHTGHGRRDGADDRIVELLHERPDRAASLVYTSDAKLRTRVTALGTQVMGSGTLLRQIAALQAAPEPADNGQWHNAVDGSGSHNHVDEDLHTLCTAAARNREHSR